MLSALYAITRPSVTRIGDGWV